MGIGTTARVENQCVYLSLQCDYCVVTFSVHVEIGFSLFDSYAVINAFIAWRNFKLKGRPEKERAYRKYGIRQARLDLIQRWCKRCSRHYKATKPHKNKRLKRVMILCNNQLVETSYFELKSMPVKPGSRYHDEPADIPKGQGYCVVCGQKTWVQCWGCLLELKDVFPVCPTSVRDCFQKMHEMRNEI